MNNTFYGIDGLYRIVRQHYVGTFPYPAQKNDIVIINKELKRLESSASVRFDDNNKSLFDNQNPAVKPESPFEHDTAISLEEYLSDQQNRDMLIRDINELRKWLEKAGYLYAESMMGHIATDLLLRTHSLTK